MAGPVASNTQSMSPNPQGQGDTLNIGQLLQNIMGSSQGQLAELAKKAATPIPGGHATALPLSMDPTPKQFQPAGYDNREVVGKGNARAQGIGNSIIGVMNAIGATKTALDNKKKLEVASATQQLLTAQQAYDQAAQLSKSDPSNADAKAAMERNKAVMNGILTNDKIRKAIEKGMNINFMDKSENDTLEHQGVAQGKQMAKAHVDYAEQFNTQTPQVMGPNQQVIAQYQAAQEAQKNKLESFKSILPAIIEQMKAGVEWDKAKLESATQLRVAATDSQAKIDVQIAKNKQEDKNNESAISLERLRGSEARLTAAASAGDPKNIMKEFQAASDEFLKHQEANQADREALNKQLDAESKQYRKDEIRAQLRHIDDMDNTAKLSFEMSRNFAAKMAGVPVEEMKVPTVHVGDNINGAGRTESRTNTRSNINPFTGKPFPNGTSSVTKVLTSIIHGGESFYNEATTDRDTENKGIGRLLPKPAEDKPR